MASLPPYIAPSHFDDPAAAFDQVRRIYDASIAHLRDALQRYLAGEAPEQHVRACYPSVRVHTDTVARVVVSNVTVLTAGTRIDQENARNGKPIPTTVVTLLVTPEDAERIALAQTDGQLMLSLRNPTDVEPTESKGARTGSLFGGPAPAPIVVPAGNGKPKRVVAAPPPEPPPPPKIYTVETIRAAKRTEEVVK